MGTKGANILSVLLHHLSTKDSIQNESLLNLKVKVKNFERKCEDNDKQKTALQSTLETERTANESFVNELKKSFDGVKFNLIEAHQTEMSKLKISLTKELEDSQKLMTEEFSEYKKQSDLDKN